MNTERDFVSSSKGTINYRVYYDPRGEDPGWVAEYWEPDGEILDDSMKVWHPMMPTRENARKKAERIARSYAKKLLSKRPKRK